MGDRPPETTDHWVVSEDCCYRIAKRVYRDRKARGLLPVKCTFSGDCQFPCYGGKDE